MRNAKDEMYVALAESIWDEISADGYGAVAITRVLIASCLASCNPDDRQMISDAFFNPVAFEVTIH
jgi:hypothetical protein